MRKSASDLITSLIVVIVLGALVGFFGWATYGFKNVDRFKEWFGIAQTELDKSVGEEQDKGTAEVGVRNGGVIHDSDDAEVTVAVQYCDKPSISYYPASVNSHGLVVSIFRAPGSSLHVKDCEVSIMPVNIFDYGAFSDTDSIQKIIVSYGDVSDYSVSSYFVYEITAQKIRDLFPNLFAGGKGAVFDVSAKSLAYDNYLDSESVTEKVYIPASEPVFEFDETIIKIGRIKTADALSSESASACFEEVVKVVVGKIVVSGCNLFNEMTYTTIPPSDSFTYTNSSDGDSVFSQDNDYYYIDLTKLSFVDTVGQYCFSPYFCKVSCNRPAGSTGGGMYWFSDVQVLSDLCVRIFEITKLTAPTNIAYSNHTLTWDYETENTKFAVFDGDNLLSTVNEKSLDLNGFNLSAGNHMIRVRALGNVGTTAKTMTAFNSSQNISQLVALTYYVGGDQITKLVPYGKSIGDYLYDVDVAGKVFGGWFKDDGYSVAVDSAEKLTGDIAVYARLSDVETVDRPMTWW